MDENVQKNGQPSLKDGTKMIYIETSNQNYRDENPAESVGMQAESILQLSRT